MTAVEKIRANTSELQLARSVAAEDLRVGDELALLEETFEYPTFLWNCDAQLQDRDEPVRIRWRMRDGGHPLQVQAICLPFVLVNKIDGKSDMVDVRLCRLARLSPAFATAARDALGKKKKNRKRKSQ